jgi:hypothetical protein
MPVATIQTPDGKTMRLQVPEGATQEQIIAFAQANYQPQSAPQPSLTDQAKQLGRDALAVAGEFAAGANRNVAGLLDFVGPDSVNAALRLSGSDKQVPTLRGVLAPTGIEGGFMEPGTARDVVAGAGGAFPAVAGFTQVPRNLATAGGAVAEFLGVGSAKPGAAMAGEVADKLSLLRNAGDVSTAGIMLDDAGNVVKDAIGKSAQKQGFEPGLVAMVKSATPDTRRKMAAMLDIVEQGKKNFRYSADNRPLNVVGDSVLNRIKVVREANRVAAVRLDDVANGLRGAQVDASPAVNAFLEKLDGMGVKFNPKDSTVAFQGSDLEGVPGPQRVIRNVLSRMLNTKVPDAYDVHRLKKFIDEQVTYGKNARGLGGKTEGILKTLRHDLDGILDSNFDAYNKVNTQYAETRGALDEIQSIAGKKFDASDDSAALTMGSLSRRFLSNAQSNGYLRDAISNLDATARKYITPGTDLVPYRPIQARSGVTPAMLENDDLIGMALYADELDKMFGAASRTSLLGDVDKGVNIAMGGKGAAAAAALKAGAHKVAGINEKNAIKAMRELLKRGQ